MSAGNSETPRMSAIVGKKSSDVISASLELPGATMPGHLTARGTRIPPSQTIALPPRKGSWA